MVKCKRCDVELEKLDSIVDATFGSFSEADIEYSKVEVLLWGGEVRRYVLYECPKCGELVIIREK